MIKNQGRVLIADEMGLGKTIQVIGYINVVQEFPALVVCPASVKYNWEQELKNWLVVEKRIKVLEGKKWRYRGSRNLYL